MRFSRMMLVMWLLSPVVLVTTAQSKDSISMGGGVPVITALSIGFGEDDFLVFNGFGAVGIWEAWSSDVWLTSGLYTGVAILGDPTSKDRRGDASSDFVTLDSEGWGINPGASLGVMIGFLPQMDIHLFGYVGPSVAVLSHFQRNNDGVRIKVDEMDEKIGVSFGGVAALAYTGNIAWLRDLSIGIDGGYHNHSFDRWHIGFTIGIAF